VQGEVNQEESEQNEVDGMKKGTDLLVNSMRGSYNVDISLFSLHW